MKLVKSNKSLAIQLGRTYRAKIPTFLSSVGTFNDRTVVWMSADKHTLRYISSELSLGDVSPEVKVNVFLSWAKMAVPMHPTINRHYQMMCYRQIKWKDYGLRPPKNSKKLKSAYG